MATIRWILVLATSAVMVMAITGSLCPPRFGPCPMKCCAPAGDCNLAIKAAGCCRIEPVTESSTPVAAQPSVTASAGKHPGCVIAQNLTLRATTSANTARISAGGPLLAHRDPVPIYLLDGSILR
jgi:hypothetical protein